MATALEKKYLGLKDAAEAEAMRQFPDAVDVIVSFGDHDCIVDVLLPQPAPSTRLVFYGEDD